MAKQNLISVELPAQKVQDILKKLDEIKNELLFLITLNIEDKKELVKLGNYYKPFVEKAKQVLDSNPEIMPQVFDKEEFYRNYELVYNLIPILKELNQLREAVENTIFVSASD